MRWFVADYEIDDLEKHVPLTCYPRNECLD